MAVWGVAWGVAGGEALVDFRGTARDPLGGRQWAARGLPVRAAAIRDQFLISLRA